MQNMLSHLVISYNAVFQLSGDGGEWIEVRKMQGVRWHPAVASHNGEIYITGGYDGCELVEF